VSKILQRSRTKVNSFHHQAIDRLGANLAITARASDGTVEGVEATDRRNVVAVQWHAECLVDRPEHAALFAWLVSAASDHRQSSNALTEAA
jgi:putative glutamine amidotransferase